MCRQGTPIRSRARQSRSAILNPLFRLGLAWNMARFSDRDYEEKNTKTDSAKEHRAGQDDFGTLSADDAAITPLPVHATSRSALALTPTLTLRWGFGWGRGVCVCNVKSTAQAKFCFERCDFLRRPPPRSGAMGGGKGGGENRKADSHWAS